MSKTSQHASLSFPALIEELRKRTPEEKHEQLANLKLHNNKSEVQRQLCEIAGRDVVNAAILHLLSWDGAAAAAVAARSSSPTTAWLLNGGGGSGGDSPRDASDGAPAASTSMGPHGAALPLGMSETDVQVLSMALAHAATCTDSACSQPDCAAMKSKLHKLRHHATMCRETTCVLCQICRASGATWLTGAGALAAIGAPLSMGGPAVAGGMRDGLSGHSSTSVIDSILSSNTAPAGASSSFSLPILVPGGNSGVGTETPERRERRKALLSHVFSCMEPLCSFPQCAAMRRKLHALVPHTNECDDPQCPHCKIWAVYQHKLCKAVAKQQEVTLRAAALGSQAAEPGSSVLGGLGLTDSLSGAPGASMLGSLGADSLGLGGVLGSRLTGGLGNGMTGLNSNLRGGLGDSLGTRVSGGLGGWLGTRVGSHLGGINGGSSGGGLHSLEVLERLGGNNSSSPLNPFCRDLGAGLGRDSGLSRDLGLDSRDLRLTSRDMTLTSRDLGLMSQDLDALDGDLSDIASCLGGVPAMAPVASNPPISKVGPDAAPSAAAAVSNERRRTGKTPAPVGMSGLAPLGGGGLGDQSSCLGSRSVGGEFGSGGGLSGEWGTLGLSGSLSIDRIFDASLAEVAAPEGGSLDAPFNSNNIPAAFPPVASANDSLVSKARRIQDKSPSGSNPQRKRRKGGSSEPMGSPAKTARNGQSAWRDGSAGLLQLERVAVRTREVMGSEIPMPASAPVWVAARVLRHDEDKILLRAEVPPNAPAALSLAMQTCPSRWVAILNKGERLVRPLDPATDGALVVLDTTLEPFDTPNLEMVPGCPVEVLGEDGCSWEVGEVLGRSATTGHYTIRLQRDPLLAAATELTKAASGGPSAGDTSILSTMTATAAPPAASRTIKGVVSSAMRLRCSFYGCRKHALLMQRPPADCDMCGRALQHPMRSSWEYQADMAEAIQFGITSAQLCSPCYKEQRQKAEDRAAAAGPSRGMPSTSALASATVTLGARDVPLAGFVEVPVRRRRQLSAEEPEDSEQQNWVQCSSCKLWQHWVCALYNPHVHQHRSVPTNADGAAMKIRSNAEPTGTVTSVVTGLQMGGGVKNADSSSPPWMCRVCLASKAEGRKFEQPRSEAERLPECELSRELEAAIARDLAAAGVECEPVRVRVVSSIESSTQAKEEMVQREWSSGEAYPSEFPYRSRGLLAFQRVEGYDIAFFMVYAQEYDARCPQPNTRRVYISYVDSVRFFRSNPDGHRSTVYRALLCAYLSSCRSRGFEHVHLWIEPPRAGDEYIFYARPPEERRPMKREKLRSWYCKLLDKSKAEGVVERYGSMLDEFRHIKSARQIPLFKGDQWEITVPAILQGEDAPGPPAVAVAGKGENQWNVSLSRSASDRGPEVPLDPRSPNKCLSRSASASRLPSESGSVERLMARSASVTRLSSIGSSQRLKGLALNKFAAGANSEDIVHKVQKQMRRLQGHFLVAKLAPLSAEAVAEADTMAEAFERAHNISYEVANSRQALLHHCMRHALQFNSLRYAQYSTMMLVHEMLHPSGSESAHYCLPGCKRGRLDDGSMMVACDACDNWLHPGCLPPSHMPASDDSFICPMCVDAKADVYLQSDCFSDMMMSDL